MYVKTPLLQSILVLGIATQVVCSAFIAAADPRFEPKGYQANGDPNSDTTTLLGQFGELIARERAFHETSHELDRAAKGNSPFAMDASMLSAVLGEDFYALYDGVLPRLEALGQKSRRDEISLRFEPEAQQQLIAGETVIGINDLAVNNVVAHYKIAIEKIDISMRQLLLAESHLMRRSADELAQALDPSGNVTDYVRFVRASRLLPAARKIKGFVQPRCIVEGDVRKRTRDMLNQVDDQFYFDENRKLQVTVQAIYDAAEAVQGQAMLLSEDGSHCN